MILQQNPTRCLSFTRVNLKLSSLPTQRLAFVKRVSYVEAFLRCLQLQDACEGPSVFKLTCILGQVNLGFAGPRPSSERSLVALGLAYHPSIWRFKTACLEPGNNFARESCRMSKAQTNTPLDWMTKYVTTYRSCLGYPTQHWRAPTSIPGSG